jgi:hypothetical protein
LAKFGVVETHGPQLDAALAAWPSDVPEGQVRAVLIEEASVESRLVVIRSPGERAIEAKEKEQDAILQAVLDRVGDDVRAQFAARRQKGNAAHNLAIFIEEGDRGALTLLVGMRSDIARILEAWEKEHWGKAIHLRPIVKALGKSAPAGQTHAVFAVRRDGRYVVIHRMTVVQGLGVN